jgi:hypothetical protein
MKFTQSELDTLSAFQSQLLEMRGTIGSFDLQIDTERSRKGYINPLQANFTTMHNSLTALANTMQKLVEVGA